MQKRHKGTEAAVSYMEEISVHLPGKSTVSKRCLTQKKVLLKRLKRLHRDLMRTNPEATTSLRSFYRHRPSHIKTSRQQAFRQGLCEICVNTDLKLDSFSAHLEQAIDGRDILSEMSVCSPPTLSCLNRNCDHCGVENAEKHIKQNLTAQHLSSGSHGIWSRRMDRGRRRWSVKGPLQTLSRF